MSNYLWESASYGGTVSDDSIDEVTGDRQRGYLTSSADSKGTSIWYITRFGDMNSSNTPSDIYFGARAVVVVNK